MDGLKDFSFYSPLRFFGASPLMDGEMKEENEQNLLMGFLRKVKAPLTAALRSKRSHAEPEAFFERKFTFLIIVNVLFAIVLVTVWAVAIKYPHQEAIVSEFSSLNKNNSVNSFTYLVKK